MAWRRLDRYIHDYMIKKGMLETAEIFSREANVYPKSVAIDSPEGFLEEWWNIFYDSFIGWYPEYAQRTEECPAEAALNVENVVPNASPVIQSFGSNSIESNFSFVMPPSYADSVASNNSPLISSVSPDSLSIGINIPDDVYSVMSNPKNIQSWSTQFPIGSNDPMMQGQPSRELTSNSLFLERDQMSDQMLSSANASSHQLQQIPTVPQQWMVIDESRGMDLGITMQMEPTSYSPTQALLPKPEPSDAGSSSNSSP